MLGTGFAQVQALNAGPCPPVPPQLLVAEGSGQVTAHVGQPLELFCQASGSPVPTLQCVWAAGGQGWGAGRQGQHAAGSVGMGGTPLPGGIREATEPGRSCLPCPPWAQAERHVPLPTLLRWLQNGRPAEELPGVEVTSRGAALRISHVELGHAGLFACQATNEAGTAGAEVELSVLGEGAGVA